MPRTRLLTAALLSALATLAVTTGQASTPQVTQSRPGGSFDLVQRGSFSGGGEAAAEIVAYDAGSQQLFVTHGAQNRVDVLDVSDLDTPILVRSIDITPYGPSLQSVAVANGLLAVAVAGFDAVTPGSVVVFDAATGAFRRVFPAGVLPDNVVFSSDGTLLMAANEGEVGDLDVADDPPGSVTLIDLSQGLALATTTQIGFESLDGQELALRAQGVRIMGETLTEPVGPGNPPRPASRDLEPEYIAIAPDKSVAFVTLQEANAFAVIDLNTRALSASNPIIPIPLKNHAAHGNRLDPSDRDGTGGGPAFRLDNWPVFGMHMPDSIAAFSPATGASAGMAFFASAGEGDDRGEVSRIGSSSIVLDPIAFPNAAALKANAALGRLNASHIDGDLDGDGDLDRLQVLGTRSFSLFDASGNQVFDSGDELECMTGSLLPGDFNSDNEENGSADSRSDNKGPEPEAIAAGTSLEQRTYVFVGLERIGGVAVYDVTDPANAFAVAYENNRDFSAPVDIADPASFAGAGDFGPEGIVFIPAEDSPDGRPAIAVANEISGTTTIWSIRDALFKDGMETARFAFACS
ncbi:choice-of-anchor I family protein [Pseudomarimonas salicorniae]|uniref:Choice-of-anchor I family protein n=1 Tax=Pseudomarimonas salicorniae TaxID=2933270 RepID=A0ABT0GGQ4_9GAMM|nr:choice-of-anchor I family protein [Lysobacter sp. CAU 1642]MCK7593723.1 choice-of-anchor I family protein [Lysobacter sp. CAU 1642]